MRHYRGTVESLRKVDALKAVRLRQMRRFDAFQAAVVRYVAGFHDVIEKTVAVL